MAAPHDERFYEKSIFTYFLFREGLSKYDFGVARGSSFQGHGRELVSKPAISLKNSWGGYRRTTPQHLTGNMTFEGIRSRNPTDACMR